MHYYCLNFLRKTSKNIINPKKLRIIVISLINNPFVIALVNFGSGHLIHQTHLKKKILDENTLVKVKSS